MSNNNNSKKRPKKFTVDNYDYGVIDHLDICKKEAIVCPICWKRTGKKRLGHVHRILGYKKGENPLYTDYVYVKYIIVHCHFALYKGTKTPAFDAGRNVRCHLRTQKEDKKNNCKIIVKLIEEKRKPDWLIDELRID